MPARPDSPIEREIDLVNRVSALITGDSEENFESLAVAIFLQQFSENKPFQRFAKSLGKTPETTRCWKEIPAVPTNAFKLTDFPLIGARTGTRQFLTSGTTTEVRGAHHFPDTTLYELSLKQTWEETGLPKLPRLYFAPSPAEAPESSLSHMFEAFGSSVEEPFLMNNSRFCLSELYRAVETGEPIFLMGTALAFLHFMKSHGPLTLPEGSHLLETGGYKGTQRALTKEKLYLLLHEFFSVPDQSIHNEYGMTELSTQAYATGAEGRHRFPSWCRPRIIHPESGSEQGPGELGYLVIHDLANVHSVAGIRTQDFAFGHPDGSFTLIGRDPGALPRGCSRTIDHSLTR